MAPKQQIKGKVVGGYVKKHPDMPRRSLARLIMQNEPGLFNTLEEVRSAVRLYTGSRGQASQIAAVRYGVLREKGKAGEDPWEDMMPESWAEPIEPFVVPSGVRRLLVLSDIHVPFHDIEALSIAIKHGIANKPDAVLLNGDTLDFYSISDHEKDPRIANTPDRWQMELEDSRQVLRMIRKAFPNVPIYFKEGNHEYRLTRYLMRNAMLLIGTAEFQLPVLLGMGELGIEYVRNKRMVYAGDLTIGHGDEWKGGGGINPARWTSLRARENAMIGHFHRVSEHVERTVRGKTRGYWSIGCLCELQPAYLAYNDWTHGFALVHLDGDGGFEVENKKIINGKVR